MNRSAESESELLMEKPKGSLREKTKTHCAELEKTIQILRGQDRNGATASLLGEIEQLQQENESLRDVIDSVRSVVGNEIVSRAAPPISPASGNSDYSFNHLVNRLALKVSLMVKEGSAS